MNKQINRIIDKIYTELYDMAICIDGRQHSWEDIKNSAITIDNNKRRYIPFESFYIDKELFDEICNKYMRYKHSFTRQAVSFNAYLGPSPTTAKYHFLSLKSEYERYVDKVNKDMTIDDIVALTGAKRTSDIVVALMTLPYMN